MVDSLNSVVSFVFETLSSIFGLYVSGSILTGVLALWLLRRVARLFDKIK